MPNYIPGTTCGINRKKIIKQINKHTTFVDGHWLFIGYRTPKGYGRIKINKKKFSIIRLSLCAFLGLEYLDWKWQANHKDDVCSYKNCWNPDHLYAGTHSENMKDSVRLGTHKEARKTHCPKGHLIQGKSRNGKRYCLVCNRLRAREYAKLH